MRSLLLSVDGQIHLLYFVNRGADGGGRAEEGDRGAEGEGPRGGEREGVDQHAAGEPQVRGIHTTDTQHHHNHRYCITLDLIIHTAIQRVHPFLGLVISFKWP